MNVLKALYCNQYYELKPKGKEVSARTNGTRLLTISVSLNIILVVLVIMVLSDGFADAFSDTIKDVFGRRRARSVGKIVALIPFLLSYPFIRYTLGREETYDKLIQSFGQLSPEKQKETSKKGLYYFIASLIGFAVAMALIPIFLA